MNKPLRLLPLAVGLLLAGLSALLFARAFHQAFLVPIFYLLYVAAGYLSALPQVLWWALLLAGVALLTLRIMSEVSSPASSELFEAKPRQLSRTQEWSRLIAQARRGGYLERQANRRVCMLALDILAQQRRVERRTVEGLLRSGELDLPPALRGFILQSLEGTPPAAPPRRFSLRRSPNPNGDHSSPSENQIRALVQFLEHETQDTQEEV